MGGKAGLEKREMEAATWLWDGDLWERIWLLDKAGLETCKEVRGSKLNRVGSAEG